MWVLTGEFHSAAEGTGQTKSKLLRTGRSYPLGRKPDVTPLCIPSNRISKDQGIFIVGKFTEGDVADASSRPILQYNNRSGKGKACLITRGGAKISINDDATGDLEDGDSLAITASNTVKVRWEPVCCFQEPPRTSSDTLKVCVSLGIHIVNIQGPEVTHHLTPAYAATTAHAISLATACNFVKPEWLDEVLALDNTAKADTPLNFTVLPAPNKYRPAFGPTLSAAQKQPGLWEPNEERLNMFAQYAFLCAGEKKREVDSVLRQLLERAGGVVSTFDIASGVEKCRKAVTRNIAKPNVTLVLVADVRACEVALGKDAWKAISQMVKGFNLRLFSANDIVKAVVSIDTALLSAPADTQDEDTGPPSSPLPSYVPNSFPEDGSSAQPKSPEPAPATRRNLVRRVTRATSQEPQPDDREDSEMQPPPLPRKTLTRRAGDAQMLTGLDDPSFLLNNLDGESSKPAAPPPSEEDPDAPRPRRKQLKRRVGVAADPNDPVAALLQQGAASFLSSGVIPIPNAADTSEEPPLKKFKALFEASGGGGDGTQSLITDDFGTEDFMSSLNSGSQTQTQTQTGGGSTGRRTGRSGLNVVPEEEEEGSQSQAPGARTVGSKRKERSFDGDDVEMADVEEALAGSNGGSSLPAAKKRAGTGSVVPVGRAPVANAVADKAPAKLGKNASVAATAGAAPGDPDKDEAFLKAVASTKRGKRAEDDFDRDFNKLKISKADLRVEEEENRPAWELLDDLDSASVGNFMVITELEVFKLHNGDAAGARSRKRPGAEGGDERWSGKPDFKKFNRQRSDPLAQKERINLYLSDPQQDNRNETNLWDDDADIKVEGQDSQGDDLDDFGPTQVVRKTQPAAKKATQKKESQSQKSQLRMLDSDSDVPPPPPRQTQTQTRKRSKPPSTVAEPPAKRTRTTRASSKAPDPKPAALFLDDSDDDKQPGGTQDDDDFEMNETQTLRTQPARRSQRAGTTAKKAIVVDNDSDDDAVFVGFRTRK